ncbi:homeobox and leucine zipper encoding a [Esox lucius]|uniref:Homeobox domain-containing protein n=1 Tax=Esox lucius TaxID=8010 RepID=A0AAY5K044_ESOLU|nr:homeobox and leucine zipper encoding a [Esox lucius]XP_010887550.1 homeobox and leucine zipper encoding a [Esox lucius]XP_010887558.1 homeobox and leucine zipper encoding a [Esox lucius]
MATHVGRNKIGLEVNMKESSKCDVTRAERQGKQASPSSPKTSHHHVTNGKSHRSSDHCATDSDGGEGGDAGVSFSTNHNSVVCLPLVSEGLKLVWTQSDQTRELDTIQELVQAFNVFPYPTSREVSSLARLCALPLDKVKVWFMVQRIKYGISWASEEIEETRHKLAGPECANDFSNEDSKTRNGSRELSVEAENNGQMNNGHHSSLLHPRKQVRHETPEPCKPAATIQHFSSSLPPPEDSYYYRPPVDTPEITDTSLSLSENSLSSPQQPQRGRYKKTKAQLAVLRSSFLRENWPAETELRRLQEETGLSRNDIRKWFSDSRYQVRNGRGLLGTSMVYPQLVIGQTKYRSQQLQPLPLVAHRTRDEENGNEVQGGVQAKGARSNGVKDSHFFQNFLSNSLEAFGEGAVGVEAEENKVVKEASVHTNTIKEEVVVQYKEKPLQFIKGSKESEIKPPPTSAVTISASSPHCHSTTVPPLTAVPTNKHSFTSTSTLQKSAHSTKALVTTTSLSSPPTSSSPLLTPAGRPRKTKEQLDVLKEHFLRCQWPKSEDYTQLVELTGLPRADVIQWFGDTRYAVKNGQLRWVQGVREQFLAELATQQNGSGLTSGIGSSGTPRITGSRKRKSHVNGATAATADYPDISPLEVYYRLTGVLHEKDLDSLCKKSRMSYQQVRDWFAQEGKLINPESNVSD